MTFEEIMAAELGEEIQLDEVIEDAKIDSLDYLQFIHELERAFHTTIPDEMLMKVKTFRDLGILIGQTC